MFIYFIYRIPYSISYQPPVSLSNYVGIEIPNGYNNTNSATLIGDSYKYNNYLTITGDVVDNCYLNMKNEKIDKSIIYFIYLIVIFILIEIIFNISSNYSINNNGIPSENDLLRITREDLGIHNDYVFITFRNYRIYGVLVKYNVVGITEPILKDLPSILYIFIIIIMNYYSYWL